MPLSRLLFLTIAQVVMVSIVILIATTTLCGYLLTNGMYAEHLNPTPLSAVAFLAVTGALIIEKLKRKSIEH